MIAAVNNNLKAHVIELEKPVAIAPVLVDLSCLECGASRAREAFERDAGDVARRKLEQAELGLEATESLESELVVSRLALEAMLKHVSFAENKLAMLTSEHQSMGEKLAQTEAELQSVRARADEAQLQLRVAQQQNAETAARTREIGHGLQALLHAIQTDA